jgi:DNA-binding NtrC family response regulator
MATLRKLNVLLLDDDAQVTRLIQKFLLTDLSDRIVVQSVNDTQRAREIIDHNGCDLLISDIEMPDSDGLEMLRFAKLRNAWTQVVFMTAHSTWDRIATAIENGAADYLLKPVDRTELYQVVSQECARFVRWQQAVTGTLRRSLAARA